MGYTPSHEDIQYYVMAERKRCVQLIERRRRMILANPADPSWTEHFAELQNEIWWNHEAPEVAVSDPVDRGDGI